MPAQPAMPQMPQQPVMPPQPQQPVAAPPPPQPVAAAAPAPPPQPVTASDPNNVGGGLPQRIDGIIQALKKVAEVGESNQEWIEEIHEQAMGNSRVLSVLLLLQLTLAEQQGIDANMLAKLMLSKDKATVENFLGQFAGEESGEG